MSAYQWFVAYMEHAGAGHRGSNWQCPAHIDSSPSLSITQGEDGRVLVYCHAGCHVQNIVDALGLSMHVLFEPLTQPPAVVYQTVLRKPSFSALTYSSRGSRLGSRALPDGPATRHVYIPGRVRLTRQRFMDGKKAVYWESSRDGREWWNGLDGRELEELPLYRFHDSDLERLAGEPIVLCESESSVDALLDAGVPATTWAGGAKSPPIANLANALKGLHVVIIHDNDKPGHECLTLLKAGLSQSVASLWAITPPPYEDARDVLTRLGAHELQRRIQGVTVA